MISKYIRALLNLGTDILEPEIYYMKKFLFRKIIRSGARGSVVGSGIILQAGRSRVPVPKR
jgi:hypothetical protein